jgi:hypothetical protein
VSQPGVALRTAVAALALASAALHAAAAARGGSSPAGAVVLVAMGLACLPCALHLVLLPRRSTWLAAAVVPAGMLAVHPLLPAGHAHAADPVLAGGLVLVPAAGLVMAVWGLVRSRRRPART